MRLKEFLADDAISFALDGGSKDMVLEAMVRLLKVDERSAATLHRILAAGRTWGQPAWAGASRFPTVALW